MNHFIMTVETQRVLLGEGLGRLQKGGLKRLGYTRLGDYATQRLGRSARHAQELVNVENALKSFPVMAAAFKSGRLSRSKVRLMLVRVSPDCEAEWVERASSLSVRRLTDALRKAFPGKGKDRPNDS